jgi:GTP-binding protein HflX
MRLKQKIDAAIMAQVAPVDKPVARKFNMFRNRTRNTDKTIYNDESKNTISHASWLPDRTSPAKTSSLEAYPFMTSKIYSTFDLKAKLSKVILVGVELPKSKDGRKRMELSLEELRSLADTAHYQSVAVLSQRLSTINPKTFLGTGKLEELTEAIALHGADAVIIDEALSPGQNRNLEAALKCKVYDRTWIILQIFGNHARTREAKTQVDLARLKYALPRLTKLWGHLSRQRGGIGMRDVGETQIELDRRLIRDEIHKLQKKLDAIDREKIVQRKNRQDAFKVSLVGYTNVGKSSLMNCMTGADTLVENKLFATLDATTRKMKRNFPFPILLSDTVGLINKLPHDLVASFKSTLDEAREADLLIKVCDINHPDLLQQMQTTDELLKEVGVEATPSILVFNKIDALANDDQLTDLRRRYPHAVFISCQTGDGLKQLNEAVRVEYEKRLTAIHLHLDYAQAGLLQSIRKLAIIVSSDYREDGIRLDLRVAPSETKRLETLIGKKRSRA